jgi:hypothetical protein
MLTQQVPNDDGDVKIEIEDDESSGSEWQQWCLVVR